MLIVMFYIIEDYTFQLMNPGVYSLTLNPNECVPGELVFKPTEVGLQSVKLFHNSQYLK